MKKFSVSTFAAMGFLVAMVAIAKAGPIGPPNGPPYDPSTVILNQSDLQAGKKFHTSSSTVDNLLTSTITTRAIILNGVTFTTAPTSGTSVYPATGTIVASKGIAATTMTLTGLMNGTTVTITGLFTGTTIHGSSMVITGTITGANLTGTNTGDATIGTANGLSLVGQAISMALATTVSTGSLRAVDFNTFNNKLSTTGNGSGLTGLTKTQVGLSNVQNVDQTDASNLSSGLVDPTLLATGTASSARYLRGDSFWALLNSTAAGLGNVTNDAQVKIADYTQKGGILVGLSPGAFSVLAPGTNGFTLIADSSQSVGMRWATSPASFTVYPATSTASFPYGLSASTINVSGLLTGTTIHAYGAVFTSSIAASNFSGTNTGDASVVVGTGLSINGQVISLATAGVTSNGALTSTDWNIFSAKNASFTVTAPITYVDNVVGIDKSSATLLGPSPVTTFLTEGTNLFYTTARTTTAISATSPLTYANGVVGINSSSFTLQGNTFNGATQLVQTNASSFVPNANIDPSSVTKQGNSFNTGSQLLQLSGGLVPNANIDGSSITKQGNSFNGVTQLVQTNSSSFVPNANLDTSSVTKQGNTFNGASQLVQLDSSGKMPAVSFTTLTVTTDLIWPDGYNQKNKLHANVKDYGATGNGSTNDSTNFQSAVTANPSVFVPTGTYVLTTAPTFTGTGNSIRGDLSGKSQLTSTIALSSFTTLRDLKISGVIKTNVSSTTAVLIDNVYATSGDFAAIDIESGTVSNVTISNSRIEGDATGVLVNGNNGGSNFRLINSSVTGNTADPFGINQPLSLFKNWIVSGNFFANHGSTSVFTAGFGSSFAASENGVYMGNIVSDAALEGLHFEDAQKNILAIGNVLTPRGKGIAAYYTDSGTTGNQPLILGFNQIKSLPQFAGVNSGIFLQSGPTGTLPGNVIMGNHIQDFNIGVYLGSIGSGQKSVLQIVDGNSIDMSTHTLYGVGNAGTGETRQYGTNISSGSTYLFGTGGHYSFGKVYSASTPTGISSMTAGGYGSFMPSSFDGFGYPLPAYVTNGLSSPETIWTLFPAGTNNRFYGRVRIRTRYTGTTNWIYTSATLIWDGSTLTTSEQISRANGSPSAPTFSVSGGNLIFVLTTSAAANLNANYMEFDGEYWDQ